MKQPFIIKCETPEVIQLQKELSDCLNMYFQNKISYNECVGIGMKLCVKILEGACNHDSREIFK